MLDIYSAPPSTRPRCPAAGGRCPRCRPAPPRRGRGRGRARGRRTAPAPRGSPPLSRRSGRSQPVKSRGVVEMETPAAETHQHEYLRQRQGGDAGGDLAVVQVELQEPVDLGSVLITSRDQSPLAPLFSTTVTTSGIMCVKQVARMTPPP